MLLLCRLLVVGPVLKWLPLFIYLFNWAMPKSIWEFWKPKKGRKVAIFGVKKVLSL